VHRTLAALGLLLFSASVLAGCFSNPEPTRPSDPDPKPLLDYPLAYLENLTIPAPDGHAVVDRMAAFLEAHSPRVTGTDGDAKAAQALAQELASLGGWSVQVREFPLVTDPQGAQSSAKVARVVEATKWGTTNPDHIIAWGGHYDTSVLLGPGDAPGVPLGTGVTVQGAYDNGSGTRVSVELARLLAATSTNKTLKVLLFNGEEEGLLGSKAYWMYGKPTNATFDVFIGFDMVGISWPAPYCQCVFTNAQGWNQLQPMVEGILFEFLGFPRGDDLVQVFESNTRNSDEATFHQNKVPTLRWAGMRTARDYPGYHKTTDTMDLIYQTAGNRTNYEQALEHVFRATYYTVLALDHVAPRSS
jgi:hypothetical protein